MASKAAACMLMSNNSTASCANVGSNSGGTSICALDAGTNICTSSSSNGSSSAFRGGLECKHTKPEQQPLREQQEQLCSKYINACRHTKRQQQWQPLLSMSDSNSCTACGSQTCGLCDDIRDGVYGEAKGSGLREAEGE
jgi:hypothetical protein